MLSLTIFQILSTGLSIVTDYTVATTGVGDSAYLPSLDVVIFALKANFATENAQIAAMGFVKVSLLLFYRRIFITRWFVWSSNILIGLVTSFTLAILLSVVFSKWPVRDQWNPAVPYNINASAVLIAFVVGNTLLDLGTLFLPLAGVRSLQMDPRRKLMLSAIFSFGSVCIIASLFRLYYAVEFSKVPATPTSLFQAPFIYNALWACIEAPVFIITTCVPSFGPLYRGKQGPRQIWLSLRSSFLKMSKKHDRPTDQSEDPLGHERHAWEVLQDSQGQHLVRTRAQWELKDVNASDETPSRKGSTAGMV
ncbi:MAG: hypothetical protein Q9204_003518 [Flavoplaca sp. TL-2023a]